MKSTKSLYWTFVIVVVFCSVSFSLAQQNQEENMAMENWMKYSTPGDSHQFLAKQEGDWDVAVRTWMQPDTPPNESKWMAYGKMILGGRYLQMQCKGTVMGMPYEAVIFRAFDNHQKSFITSWLDNMGTGIFQGRGNLDSTRKSLTEIGEMYDPMMGHNMNMKTVTILLSDNRFTVAMFHSMPGSEEFKSMEMVFTRMK